jgi:hypothetical protein
VGEKEGPHLGLAVSSRSQSEIIADLYRDFPALRGTKWKPKSPEDDDYQCIAWAGCFIDRHAWPSYGYWWFPERPGLPLSTTDVEATVDHFMPGFRTLGYEECGDNFKFEFGYQRVAIYANRIGVTHMARQHFFGLGWLSKLGTGIDIFHKRLEDIAGDVSPLACSYGVPVLCLKRSWITAAKNGDLLTGAKHAFRFWYKRVRG